MTRDGRRLLRWLIVVAALRVERAVGSRVGDAPSKKLASQELSGAEVALAGAMARVVAQTVLHPLDVVRTRTQATRLGTGRGIGVMAYGIAPQVLLSGPAGALQFSLTDFCRTTLERAAPALAESPEGRALIQLVSAAAGTTLAASVRVPQELVKQGCMAELYPDARRAVTSIWTSAGPLGFYRGGRETIVRDVLWNSLSFAFFRLLSERSPASRSQYLDGILAGSLAALLTHPLDVLKTRVMTSTHALPSASLFTQLIALVKAEGPLVLLKGILPRLLYLGPLASLVLATNELIATFLLAAKSHRFRDALQPDPAASLDRAPLRTARTPAS